MAKGKGSRYHDEKTRDDEANVDEFAEHGNAKQGHWRPPYGLLAALCVLSLIIGFGGGFGAGWASHKPTVLRPNTVLVTGGNTTIDAIENVDIIRSFLPIDYEKNVGNDRVYQHYQQTSILNPAFHALSVVISTLGGTNNTYDPNVLRIYILSKYRGNQDTLAKLFEVAQRLQISPEYDEQLYSLTTSLMDVFQYIRNNQGKIGAPGRHLLAANSAEPLAVQLLKAFVKSGLQSPVLQGALGDLSGIWTNVDDIVDLVVDVFNSVRAIAAQASDIATSQENYHSSLTPTPPQEPSSIVGFANKSVKVTVNPYIPLIVGEVDDDMVQDPPKTLPSGPGRRMLQQSMIPLPDGFSPSMPASMPSVLVPTVWHFLFYQDGNGQFGPPGIAQACDMAQRMITIANFRLAPSKFQLFMQECRNTGSYQYLVKESREDWLDCATGGYIVDNCGEIIPDSIKDFPRAINIYVAGEQPPTSWAGYGWAPGSTVLPEEGHVGLSWTSVSTDGANNRKLYESGTSALVHEVLHHLGMDHTFVNGNTTADCRDGDADVGVTDTPVALNPVWRQPWANKAYTLCMNAWNKMLSSNWDTANRAASVRVGIPAEDVNPAFDSCPNFPGTDEIANYITYTYDICLAVMGHLTSGQIVAMHQITADANPTLYAWGQWYAQNPPPGAIPTPSPSPPPPSPPPPPPPSPPPPPPAQGPIPSPSPIPLPSPVPVAAPAPTACYSVTQRGSCKCARSWSFMGLNYQDCVAVNSADRTGGAPWCSVDNSNGDCTKLRNGWWDYCTVNPACAVSSGSSPPPSPPPPSPPPPPPPANAPPACGAGAPTKSGLVCTSSAWKLKGDVTQYTGCANPTSDPKGVWCVLKAGTATPLGAAWDYCADGCNARAPSASPNPNKDTGAAVSYPYNMQCQKGITIQGNPSTCTCADSYNIGFDGTNNQYKGMSACTMFAETAPSGMCVLACTNNKAANKRAYVCSCTQ